LNILFRAYSDTLFSLCRYDGRGHLFDLRPYDADNTANRGTLSSEEVRIERLCEEERYLELHTDLAEKAIQEEEELKRLNLELSETDGYQAVGFSYDNPGAKTTTQPTTGAQQDTSADAEEDDFEFIPPSQLCLPRSMDYPPGTKLNSLIEKTAKYVSQHGGQMEIMIKTKQANNPQFAFLSFEHNLNPYYKHQVYMIKSGRYNPDIHNKPPPPKKVEVQGDSSTDNSDDDDDAVGYLHPSLRAKANTSGKLTSSSSEPSLPQLTAAQLESTAYGQLIKKLAIKQPSLTNSPQRVLTPTLSEGDSNSQSGFPSDYPHPTDTYMTDQYNNQGGDSYYQQNYLQQGSYTPPPPPSAPPPPRPSSPTEDIKSLIERLLTYVKKDGQAFEKQVLQRNDNRFSFLQPGDNYYQYYKWRRDQLFPPAKETSFGESSQVLDARGGKGVSFSIKQKEPEASAIDTSRVALPVDPESDEDETQNPDSAVSAHLALLADGVVQGPAPAPGQSAGAQEEKPPLSQDEIDRKQAEQKLRDKLAAAARDKMSQVTQHTKEKELQAERKKRAAMFINMLKSKNKSSSAPIGPELPPFVQPPLESAQDSGIYEHNHGRSRSPPTAYTVKVNRDRSHRHHGSSSSRHRSDDMRSSSQRDAHLRDSRGSREASPYSRHGRRRRTPSPVLIKRRRSQSPKDTSQYRTAHTTQQRETTRQSGHDTRNAEGNDTSEDNNEFMLKVRQMLKASRQKVYKEDLFGD